MPDNILIIMADQLTAALTGAYGHPVVKTPALDRLCEEGVRFDAAYTPCPLCTPARAALLSGRYVSRTRSYDNAGVLASDVPTFAHHLRLAGYEVVASGKMHLIGADQLHGFERRLTTDIYPSDCSWTSNWQEIAEAEGKPLPGKAHQIPQAGPCDWSLQLDYDEEVHFRALEFLRAHRHANRERPFCLLVSYTHPHPPYLAPHEFWDLYEGADIEVPQFPEDLDAHRSVMDRWVHHFEGIPPAMARDAEAMRKLRRAYYGMVSCVDAKVAELLASLDSLGMRDDTMVIFTADHGDMLGERELIEKRVFYEWSARVPMTASFPSRWPAGRTCDEPVSLIDLFPTLIDIADAPAPIGIDGASFLDLLEGKPSDANRTVISESHGEGVMGLCFMVRKGRWKYIYVHGHDRQLFDLETDPGEWHNLAGRPETAEIQAKLHQELASRFDMQALTEDIQRSHAEKAILRAAMREGERTRWDYQPFFDATKSWLRG